LGLPGDWLYDDYSIPNLAWFPRPLTRLTFWLQWQFFGDSPWAFRAANIALHAISVQLAYRALSKLFPAANARWAFWAAAVFAVHPLQAHAVLYVFARPTILMSIFLWPALGAYLDRRPLPTALYFGLALLSKEEAVAFPLVMLLIRRDWRQATPLVGMSALWIAATLAITSRVAGSGAGSESGITPWAYLASQPTALWEYTKATLLPWFPAPFLQPTIHAPTWHAALWWIPIALAWYARRFPLLAAALLLLAPTSSIFPLQETVAFRRMYLPVAVLALAFQFLPRRVPAYLVVALTALAGYDAYDRWRDSGSLWRHAALTSPSWPVPVLQSARSLHGAQATAFLNAHPFPDIADYHTELGRAALEQQQPAAALRAFGKALALAPERAIHTYNRGVALRALGQEEAARADFARALSIDPSLTIARESLRNAAPTPSAK
jgi:tetratricopeptide (TPR) repeat protein